MNHNAAGNGRRDGLKIMGMVQWIISSQAPVRKRWRRVND